MKSQSTWRPTSNSEASQFWGKWCEKCDNEVSTNEYGDKCALLGGCAIGIYPAEFSFSEDGRPICRAFMPIVKNDAPTGDRCTGTRDMFPATKEPTP